ncbi:hypothetical protein Pcinc_009191 [Petrolisthes cinctipes]|uniref:Uncharacterized protein n=1 Tax=Petrolisthes cinctipes TaxID=88211 RepID=A0AAE1KVS4_PETCI|nr:hypothetical protein Pcinc_009191 [Petrolisthes cinctipes]
MSKPKKHQKRVECEVLIDNVENLARKGEVTVKSTFKQEIVAKASKTRGHFNSSIINRRHNEAVKQLSSDDTINIRKAVKNATYVLMNTSEYFNKIDAILADDSKFVKISKVLTESLKKKLTSLPQEAAALAPQSSLTSLLESTAWITAMEMLKYTSQETNLDPSSHKY